MARSASPSTPARILVTVLAGLAFIGAVTAVDASFDARGAGRGARIAAEAADAGVVSAADLQAKQERKRAKVDRKLTALAEATANGLVGQERAPGPGATGWLGEISLDATADDWEPAIAADPNAPYVYALATRYGAGKPCPGNCPTPFTALWISQDGGATWSDSRPLCACKGGGQFDPIIEVVPSTGHVYALHMVGYNVVFMKSTDHGQTWSAPVKTYGKVSWNDKPVLAMSDDGRDVYTSWNGPTGGDPWVAQSHDFGATWTQAKLVNSDRYYFAFDADVAPDGTVYLGESSLRYGGGGNKGTTPTGTVDHHAFVSTDRGATWTNRTVAQVQPGVACVADGCTPDFYLGHNALSVDASGALVYLYDGATTPGGPQTVAARRSTNRGVTWSAAVNLSTSGENATSPAVESRGSGDVRGWWMETAGGNPDTWNVWYRRSSDGGTSWSAAVKISDAAGGAAYKTAEGFLEVYGDYGEIAITSAGKAVAIWGEGFSWNGPGGVWLNREQ